MLTYNRSKYIDPTEILRTLGLSLISKDDETNYYSISRKVNDHGYKYTKSVDIKYISRKSDGGQYCFFVDSKLVFLVEIIALLNSDTLDLPTTNKEVDLALAKLNDLLQS